ncbi:hypothetical protein CAUPRSCDRAFT_13076 [Caulochytrium protostelioides]|uniref:GPI mannosyltransferase 1 n=1 Tax=Caulochytrium protostelioides TaxID=1555241 RepID=A0A4P9WUX4_9FUNG|nr:hypothetical protein CAUPRSCDRAFT_13076 [Caulochytrium protostelioides]
MPYGVASCDVMPNDATRWSPKQYFMWYLCFAPLLWATWRGPSRGPLLLAGLGWVVTQGLWLHAAFQFEFQAKNTFRSMWFASLAFLAANTAVLVILVRGCRPLRIADGDGADHEAMAADAKKTT